MLMLEQEQLVDLEDAIIDSLASVLRRKNEDGSLERLLREMGLDEIVNEFEGVKDPLTTWSDGQVLVLGAKTRMANDLAGVCKSLGIDKRRLELVEYDEVTNYDIRNLSYSSKYCVVLAGAMPHSVKGMEGESSGLVHLEKHRDEFPEVVRLYSGEALKVTKTNFRQALEELIARGVVMPDAA